MINAANQMAAMSAAIRMLLARDPLNKPRNLLIAATNGVTDAVLDLMMSHALEGRSTFLAIFHVEDDIALLERIMVFDGSTKKGEINIGGGRFIQKACGSFAIRSHRSEDSYEYYFSRGGRRLARRAVSDKSHRAMMEKRGLQALMAMAATPACLDEAHTASMTDC